jgi:hypothetical protein
MSVAGFPPQKRASPCPTRPDRRPAGLHPQAHVRATAMSAWSESRQNPAGFRSVKSLNGPAEWFGHMRHLRQTNKRSSSTQLRSGGGRPTIQWPATALRVCKRDNSIRPGERVLSPPTPELSAIRKLSPNPRIGPPQPKVSFLSATSTNSATIRIVKFLNACLCVGPAQSRHDEMF